MKLDCIHFVWVHECAPVEVESDLASERTNKVSSNSFRDYVKAALIASLDRLVTLTISRVNATHWHLVPDLADRIAFAVTDLPRITVFVGSMVKDRDSWIKFARELSAQWGVYVSFKCDNIMNLPQRMGPNDYYVVVGTREELKIGEVAKIESLYMMIVNSEVRDASYHESIRNGLRAFITERLK